MDKLNLTDDLVFEGSLPNLISSKTLEEFESQYKVSKVEKNNKFVLGVGYFYSNYIIPNLFPLIIISFLIIYIFVKYVIKKDNKEKKHIKKIKPLMLKKQVIDDEIDISDVISDDYLLTDEEKVLDEDLEVLEQNDPYEMVDSNQKQLDAAAKIIFGTQ
jgi:hypothetical protein